MQFQPYSTFSRFIGRRDGRRIPGRLSQVALHSSLGPVIDLSSGGVRLLTTRPQSDRLRLTLWGEEVELNLTVKVAWCRKHGFRRYELGLTFLDIDEAVGAILTRMATNHARRTAI